MALFLSLIRDRRQPGSGVIGVGLCKAVCQDTSKNWDRIRGISRGITLCFLLALQNKISGFYFTPNIITLCARLCVCFAAVIVFHSQRAEVRQPRQLHYYIPLLPGPRVHGRLGICNI